MLFFPTWLTSDLAFIRHAKTANIFSERASIKAEWQPLTEVFGLAPISNKNSIFFFNTFGPPHFI